MKYRDINSKDIRVLDLLYRNTGLELVVEDGRITQQIETKESQAVGAAQDLR